MKKIFFVAVSAILLAAGCQKTEIINQVNPVGEPSMAFNPEMGKLTKGADDPGMDNLKTQDFRLWAYFVEADPSRSAAENSVYDHMENILVSDTNDSWGTAIQHFWPGTGKALKFFAVSGVDNATINNDRTELTVENFTVNHSAPDTDLMVADYIEADQASYNKNVPLNFKHALSKVQFQFANAEAGKGDATEVYVQGMYVGGIKTVANLTATVSGTTPSFTTTMAWNSLGVSQTFVGDYETVQTDGTLPTVAEADIPLNRNDYTAAVDDEGYMKLSTKYQTYTTWLVIPQDVKKDATPGVDGAEGTPAIDLKISILYIIGNRQFVSTFSLGTDDVAAWARNQYVKYKVNLTPNMIGFTPTVEDWTPVNTPNEGEQGENGVNDPSNDGQDVNINN